MTNKPPHIETRYPEKEGTVYRGTVNSGYYKDPDKGIDDLLEDCDGDLANNELYILMARVGQFTTNALHAIGI